jgi:hypothetical protein
MTNLDTIAEVWEALRMHIDLNERKEAAETLVNYLMENNYEASEIKEEFRGDKDIAKALLFLDDRSLQDEEEDDYDDDYDDYERY